ncbi:MAG: hypothetical protein SWQ30_14670 [Thermodesulfobacteriota bacterium]|nr:hypothetical protein [Thermodesulfobacteriota bacterium]
MKIIADWPRPEELIENEVATLEAMGNNPSLGQVQPQLAGAAKKKYQYYENMNRKEKFSFSSWIVFPGSPIVSKAIIECLIVMNPEVPNSYDMVTYSFALCRLNRERKDHLIKKFHIDFTTTPKTGRLPLHPVFHLQSPGKLSVMLKDLGLKDDHLEPKLSEPRLCFAPTTLALLVDFLLREFGGDRASTLTKLTRESRWRGLIRDNENLVLKPFFQACSGFFHDRECKKDPERHQLFSQDFAYGQC